MGETKIEWADRTWNPLRGCSKVSEGCRNCYAIRVAHRFGGSGQPYEGLTQAGPGGPNWTGKVKLVPEVLEQPLKWRKPQRVFVNSMSDIFHIDVPFEYIRAVWARMAGAPEHTFMVLTKRPARALEFFAWMRGQEWRVEESLPNVWLGVSVEDQKAADERIPLLLQTPAAVRFLSCEPLLGPVDLNAVPRPDNAYFRQQGETGCITDPNEPDDYVYWHKRDQINWVIVGGESGPGARPMHPDWARSLRDQCTAAGVAFHFKQWGEWAPGRRMQEIEIPGYLEEAREGIITLTTIDPPCDAGKKRYASIDNEGRVYEIVRIGKKSAGRMLDGREWNEFPEVRV